MQRNCITCTSQSLSLHPTPRFRFNFPAPVQYHAAAPLSNNDSKILARWQASRRQERKYRLEIMLLLRVTSRRCLAEGFLRGSSYPNPHWELIKRWTSTFHATNLLPSSTPTFPRLSSYPSLFINCSWGFPRSHCLDLHSTGLRRGITPICDGTIALGILFIKRPPARSRNFHGAITAGRHYHRARNPRRFMLFSVLTSPHCFIQNPLEFSCSFPGNWG